MNRRLTVAAAAAVSLLVLTACTPDRDQVTPTSTPTAGPTAAPTASGVDVYAQNLKWEKCDDLECATIQVPLNWDNPTGETVALKINKLPATGKAKGSLLINPGGPGGSGLDFTESFGTFAGDDLLAAYDVIGFDPRGVGTSSPVDCGDTDTVNKYVVTDWPLDTQEDVDAANKRNQDFGKGCEQATGSLISNIDTVSVARDMDVIRSLVGDDKLNYLGFSYGTQLGATYAELYPDKVGQMVLDGVVDSLLPSDDQAAGQATGFEGALTNFVQWCEKEKDCPLDSNVDAAKKQIHDIAYGAIANPVPGNGIDVNGNLMVYGIVVTLYDEGSWQYLEQALTEVIQKHTADLMATLADFYLDRDAETGEYKTNSTVVFTAISCLDQEPEPAWDLARVDQFKAKMEQASPTFGWWFASSTGCSDWPFEAAHRITSIADAASVTPILTVGTTHDPATPYKWAESVTKQLGNATLLTYDGEGHTAYGRSNSCIVDAVDGWLVDGKMPATGTVC